MKVSSLVLLIPVFLLPVPRATSLLVEGSSFGNLIRDFVNSAVGVGQIQEYFNGLSYRTTDVEGAALITEVSSSLGSKFSGPIQALERLKTTVEQEIASFEAVRNFVECCQANSLEYDERFRHTVNTNAACISISSNSPSSIRYPTKRIEDMMKENYRNNPALKWQYLGTEDGILLNYPTFKASTCRNYDPRFRPFYVSSATPVEKDIVIIIDTSGSMSATHNGIPLMQIAQHAAISVLQTLNPNDRFGVISLYSTAEVIGSKLRPCVNLFMLSQATPINIKFFEREINGLIAGGATNYEAALDTAFNFFRETNFSVTGEEREHVILFLTDGEKTAGGDPLALITERNGQINNKVTILTYGLGAALSAAAQKMLSDIANQTYSNPSQGEIQRGIFEHIKDPSKLRSAMASYYNLFSSGRTQTHATFSVPYIDAFGLGLITSLCLPVYKSDNSLFGVVCSDLTMSNLVSDITYFQEGENSYSFIIDGRGRTIMHPLLPVPSQLQDDPIYVYIQHLERSSEALEVTDSMKSGKAGNKTFSTTRTFSRGDIIYEGIRTYNVEATYYWKPVPGSNFSLCIVVGYNDKQTSLRPLQARPEVFNYHRRDLLGKQTSNCVQFNRYATKENSAVMITPGGFVDPSFYLEREETELQIQQYTAFLTGSSSDNPGFKPSVIYTVSATYKAEEIWRSNPEGGRSVVWRYIGTADGVMRVYPAAQLPKNYDHTRRPWYKRSLAHKGKVVFSAPYLDLWGAGFLITISTVLTEPSSARNILGVIGTDVTLQYLYQTLISSEENCISGQYDCFIVDDSGFVVLHKDFIEPTTKLPNLVNVHLVTKNPVIAMDLVQNNYMTKTYCIDFKYIKEQYTYRINLPPDGIDRTGTDAKYVISPVPETNVFIVIQRKEYFPPPLCCEMYGTSPDVQSCSTLRCGCLCFKTTDFNFCSNKFQLLADAGQTCAPRPPVLETASISETQNVKGLPLCFDNECSTKQLKSDCYSTSGCSWCSKNHNFISIQTPYCARQESCYFGIEGLSTCTNVACQLKENVNKEEKSVNIGMIIGVVIGVFVFLVVIVICVITRRRKAANAANNHVRSCTMDNTHQGQSNNRTSSNNHPVSCSSTTTTNPAFSVPSDTDYHTANELQPADSHGALSDRHPVQPSAPPSYEESNKHYGRF